MRRILAWVVVLVLVGLPACGGGGDDGRVPENFELGPFAFAMPLLPTIQGELLELGLQNLSNSVAPVTVTAYTPSGAPYPAGSEVVVLPPRGAERLPVTRFTGTGIFLGGWLYIETRDVGALDPATGIPGLLPSSGLIVPAMTRRVGGIETDESGGVALRGLANWVTITEETTAVQLINASWEPMAGGAVGTTADFDIVSYDAFGTILDTTSVELPPFGSIQVDFSRVNVGRIEVFPATGGDQSAPAGTVFRNCIATQEWFAPVFFETRFLEMTDPNRTQLGIGFDLEFGVDEGFNIHDFGVYFGNPTNNQVTIQLAAINTATGQNLLPNGLPRLVSVAPHATKFMATTQIESRGLDQGELTIFGDIFGNVDAATSLTTFELVFTVPREADISARDYDSRAASYRRILPGYRQTTDIVIPVMEYETITTTTTTNFATFANPFNSTVLVNIRGYTPGGTEYILDPFEVGPFARVAWSPDGLVFREVPTDITAPPVQFMTFLFSTSGGLFMNGRRLQTDNLDRILYQRPFVIRNLRAD